MAAIVSNERRRAPQGLTELRWAWASQSGDSGGGATGLYRLHFHPRPLPDGPTSVTAMARWHREATTTAEAQGSKGGAVRAEARLPACARGDERTPGRLNGVQMQRCHRLNRRYASVTATEWTRARRPKSVGIPRNQYATIVSDCVTNPNHREPREYHAFTVLESPVKLSLYQTPLGNKRRTKNSCILYPREQFHIFNFRTLLRAK